MKNRRNKWTAMLLTAAMAAAPLAGAVPAFADTADNSVKTAAAVSADEDVTILSASNLTDGEYSVNLESSLGMFHFDNPIPATVKGDQATLHIVCTTDHARYDQMFIGKYDEIDDSKAIHGTPVNGAAGEDGTNYDFEVTIPTSDLVKGNQIYYVVRYRQGYSEDHNGDWYKGKSGDYYFTVGDITQGSSTSTTTTKASADQFTDVSSSAYYYNALVWAVAKDIASGTSATTFSPNQNCTRAQAALFLYRLAGSPDVSNTSVPFTDVPRMAYYHRGLIWAYDNGIISGKSATLFAPNDAITRGQMATLLYNYAKYKNLDTTVSGSNPFSDVSDSAYYRNAVVWASEKGVTSGTGNGKFSPNAACTRAQMVQFLYLLNRLK